jgi:hypothetical protein
MCQHNLNKFFKIILATEMASYIYTAPLKPHQILCVILGLVRPGLVTLPVIERFFLLGFLLDLVLVP